VRPDFGGKKVPGLSRGKEWASSFAQPDNQKDWVGGGCRHGINPQGREREGGFPDRASWAVLGKFGLGSEDSGEENASGEEIGRGDLFVPSATGCASGVGEFDWAVASVGIGEFEAKPVRCGYGKDDRVEGGKLQVEVEGFGESLESSNGE